MHTISKSKPGNRKKTVDTLRCEPDLSVIIVNYNVREFLEQALRSIERASKNLSVEVFVVDNNSADGSVEMVQEQFPDVRLIVNESNVGFGRANNQAIRLARGRFLLILNPDTIVEENTFSRLIHFMEQHPDCGACGCKILNPDGTFALESRRSFPTPQVAFFRTTGLSRLFPRSRLFGRYNMTYLPEDQVTEVDALSGSCMLVRRTAVFYARAEADDIVESFPVPADGESVDWSTGSGAGGFDEDFFMYGEDLDWCYRIQSAGWKIYYTPETEIIHYKGESTKKGELRYVRLFYGAMLQFAHKHFHSRYSSLFIVSMRVAIFARAFLSLLASTLSRSAPVLLDMLLAYGIAVGVGTIRSKWAGVDLSVLFYLTVAPAFALGTVLSIVGLGGYRYSRRRSIRPVILGTILGIVFVATMSFFIKDIAFSRMIVVLLLPATVFVLAARRLLQRTTRNTPRKAVLVGRAAEARRLFEMVGKHPNPPFYLAGFVAADNHEPRYAADNLPRMGFLRQLRDIIRLQRIDEVIFASGELPNTLIFRSIRQLKDLPVQFKMFSEGRTHVIGKASVEDLSLPNVVEADDSLVTVRSGLARRTFEIPIALLGLLLHPLIYLLSLASSRYFWKKLVQRTKLLPSVLTGRRALIGYDEARNVPPPEEYDVRPGVFSIMDSVQLAGNGSQDVGQVYWYYARNQCASLDWDILVHCIRTLKG